MKRAGWILIVISVAVIFYNAVLVWDYNQRQVDNHPFITLFSFGTNLKNHYTFTPPYTEFEIFIIALGIGGIVMVRIARNKQLKDQGQEPDKKDD